MKANYRYESEIQPQGLYHLTKIPRNTFRIPSSTFGNEGNNSTKIFLVLSQIKKRKIAPILSKTLTFTYSSYSIH